MHPSLLLHMPMHHTSSHAPQVPAQAPHVCGWILIGADVCTYRDMDVLSRTEYFPVRPVHQLSLSNSKSCLRWPRPTSILTPSVLTLNPLYPNGNLTGT